MIKIFDSFNDIHRYSDDWNELAAIQQSALLTFDWFHCCAQAFHSQDQLYLICVIENKQLNAVAPLYRSVKKEQRGILQIIGNRRLYEPTSLLYRDRNALGTLLNACKSTGFPLFLSRCYQTMDLSEYFSNISWRGLFHAMPATDSQYLDLSCDFDSYQATLSSRRKYDIRRAVKKAQQLGQLDYVIHTSKSDDVSELLQQAFDIENSNWKNKAGSSIALNADLNKFFLCLFLRLSISANAVIGFLTINGRPVACNLAINQFDRLWILKIGYHQEFSSCSPGILLTHEMIRYACSRKLRGFEFLGCSEQWIKLWKPQARDYLSYLYYPLSFRGLKGFIVDASRKMTNKLTSRL